MLKMADTYQPTFVGDTPQPTPTGQTLQLLTPDKYAQLQNHCENLKFLVGKAPQSTPTSKTLQFSAIDKPAQLQLSQTGKSTQLESDKEIFLMETITQLSKVEGLVVSVGKTMTGTVLSGLGFFAGGLLGGRYGAMLGNVCCLVL